LLKCQIEKSKYLTARQSRVL